MRSHDSRHSNHNDHRNIPHETTAAQAPPSDNRLRGRQGHSTAPAGHRSISLGADPGALLAGLPAMLGFTPQDSLVLIGLQPVSKDGPPRGSNPGDRATTHATVTFQVGPVVRADLDGDSTEEALDTFCAALGAPISDTVPTDQCPQAIILVIGGTPARAVDVFTDTRTQLALAGIPVHTSHWAQEIADHQEWATYDLHTQLWVDEGTIPVQSANPVALHAGVTNALNFAAREDMECWLDQQDPPLAGQAEPQCLDTALHQLLAKTEEILDGFTTVEDAMADLALLTAIARLCGEPRSQAFLITTSIGMPSPVIRSLLAATARHTAGDVRSNVLYVLTQVLVGNGEGVVAFHTARRAVSEATSAMGWKDNQVLVIALKTGLALQIVKDKVAIATGVLNGKNPREHVPADTREAFMRVLDWDALEHLRHLDTEGGELAKP
ncbi:DUF4192 domain-containing protein [Corynebacterium sp. HMSC22B11]|nr:DUF4192 domain-containing protein [Corynebacterium sp. HMSC22B11]